MKSASLTILLAFSIIGAGSASEKTPVKAGVHTAIATGSDMGDHRFGYGAQVEVGLVKHLGLEFGVTSGFGNHDIDLFNTIGSPAFMDVHTTTFTASAVFRKSLSENFEGYLVTGISYDDFKAEGKTTSDISSPGYVSAQASDGVGFQLGCGLDYVLIENLELVLEYRYFFTTLDADITTPRLGGGTDTTAYSDDIQFGALKIGLNYHF